VSAPAPEITVVVVAYNAGPHLARCVAALAAQTHRDFDVVIVDNASTDGSVAALRLPERFRIFDAGANLGFAAGCNRGAAASRSPWLAMLNPDAFPAPDWLARMIAATHRHPSVAMFGAVLVEADAPTRFDGLGDFYSPYGIAWRGAKGHARHAVPAEARAFSPCAAAALYRRDAFEAVGGFDERYFCYFEDVDLGARLRLAGSDCVVVGDAVVDHVGSGITGRWSQFAVYHGYRNRLWTYWKVMPGALAWLFLPLVVVAHAALLLNTARRGALGAALRGVRDAVAGIGALRESRRGVQERRRIGVGAFARALTWSPVAIVTRKADLRPMVRD